MRNHATGQLLRFLGMAVEAGSLLGMVSLSQGKSDVWEKIPFDASILLCATFVLGLCMWFVGLRIIRLSRMGNGST